MGDLLNRTAAACGFRWNAVVRKLHEDELTQAKKERKEKMRLLQSASRKRMQPLYVMTHPNGAEATLTLSSLSLDIVIAYLMKLQHDHTNVQEVQKWQRVATVSMEKIRELEERVAELKKENIEIKEDYEQFVNIMNRARQFVTLGDAQLHPTPVFKMERNGNLVSTMESKENSDLSS